MAKFNLSGKRALVTGASSGLGAHFAEVLAEAGAHVIMAARRVDALAALAQRLRGQGCTVEPVELDLRDRGAIDRIADQIAKTDILVNNAGIVREKPALAQSEEDWDQVVDTNLKGMFFLAQTVGRAMKDSGTGGSIINIASILGLRQAGGVLPYAVSKAGVIQLTKALALEWARYGIRVNALAPGYMETELNADFWNTEAGANLIRRIPQRRLGRKQDLDGALLLLASDASAYMTGSVIAIDGGHLISGL